MTKIQLALQGGGAKLMALLAAMEAVEEKQTDAVINVTRLAGTSAGSIVAALFSAGFSMRGIRRELQGDVGKQILCSFPPRNVFRSAHRNIRGQPVWNTEATRSWLKLKLEQEKRIIRFRDFTKQVEVVSTDLRSGGAKTYGLDDNVVEAVMDSCAIPFYFRSWKVANAGSLYVDGGICENLPIWNLKAREVEVEGGQLKWGKAIAFSFVPECSDLPKNVCEFSRALLVTAIDNSVYRAKQVLGADSVHEIVTHLKTFDFSAALTSSVELEREYDRIRAGAQAFLLRVIGQTDRTHQLLGYDWDNTNLPLRRVQEDLGAVCRRFYGAEERKYFHWSCTATGNSLVKDGSPEVVSYTSVFAAVQEPIRCTLTQLIVGRRRMRTKWKIADEHGNPVRVLDIPIRDRNNPDLCKVALFYLDNVPIGARVTEAFEEDIWLERQDLNEISSGLQFSEAGSPIDRIDLVLFVPRELPGVTLDRSSDSPPGRSMTENELRQYPPPSQNYYPLGWRGDNIQLERGGPSFSAQIILPQVHRGG